MKFAEMFLGVIACAEAVHEHKAHLQSLASSDALKVSVTHEQDKANIQDSQGLSQDTLSRGDLGIGGADDARRQVQAPVVVQGNGHHKLVPAGECGLVACLADCTIGASLGLDFQTI